MIVNSHNSEGSSTRARKQTLRWRTVFIALVLALSIGSAGQILPAQAAPASADFVDFDIAVAPEKPPTICTGKALTFYVSISKEVLKTVNGKDLSISGPTPLNPHITGKVTNGPGKLIQGLDEDDTEQRSFIFSSDKPGDATIKFTATITNKMIGANEIVLRSSPKRDKGITLKIQRCKVKVSTIGEWKIPGQAQGYVGATSNDADVKAPDAESAFTGSTSVNWVASVGRVRDCGGAATIGSSKLDWNGTMNDSDQLTLNGNFQTAAGTFDVKCARGGESIEDSMKFEFTPDPVSLTIASSGGTVNQSQTLEWEGANSGQITIIIFPVEDTGVALTPGFHAVSWDDFSSLFAALIPLP